MFPSPCLSLFLYLSLCFFAMGDVIHCQPITSSLYDIEFPIYEVLRKVFILPNSMLDSITNIFMRNMIPVGDAPTSSEASHF